MERRVEEMAIFSYDIADTKKSEFATMNEITNALKVGREYVYSRILPYVEHTKIGTKTAVKKSSLSNWLMKNAEFTRQTIFVPEWLVEDYKSKFKAKYPADTFEENPIKYLKKRKALPFRTVKPFDIWEKAVQGRLIHSKLFLADSGGKIEDLYREMFKRGAIKIMLGHNKTFFYVPEGEGILCPAMDEVFETEKKEPLREIKTFEGIVKSEGDPILLESLKNLLRRHYIIEDSQVREKTFEMKISKQFPSVDGVIVTRLKFK